MSVDKFVGKGTWAAYDITGPGSHLHLIAIHPSRVSATINLAAHQPLCVHRTESGAAYGAGTGLWAGL